MDGPRVGQDGTEYLWRREKITGLRSPAIILGIPAFYVKMRRDVKIYGRGEGWGGGSFSIKAPVPVIVHCRNVAGSVLSGFLNSSLWSVLCCHLVSDHPGLDSSCSRRQGAGQRPPPKLHL